jgi:hypothetical protein
MVKPAKSPKPAKSTPPAQPTSAPAPPPARLQVICTQEQAQILTEAATKAGLAKDRSSWILAQALRAAKDDDGSLTITGDLAEKVRTSAAAQGITPEKFLRLLVA